LSLLAAHFCQQIGGAAVFNAFSDNRQAEQRAQTDGGADDGSIVDFDPQLTHKRLVDFQSADRELLQVGQTCIASSEIVEQDTDAEVPYLAKNFDGILIVDEDVLGDFDLETVLSLASAGAGIRFFLADQWQAGFGRYSRCRNPSSYMSAESADEVPLSAPLDGLHQFRMPTARDATSAMVASDMADSAIIRSLALTVRGNVSAGENAVAFVNARNR